MRLPFFAIAALALLVTQEPDAPDLMIVNARVFTGDAARPWARSVLVTGESITGVSENDVSPAMSRARRVIDAGGRLLIPGIDDAHTHVDPIPRATVLEGPPAMEHDPPLDEMLARLRTAVPRTPAGQWIVGEIGELTLDDSRSTRATLDPVSGGHPVRLHAASGHGSILNTAALRALGIKDDEPDPPGGTFARAADGRTLTGRADEYADVDVGRRLAQLVPKEERVRAFADYAKEAASFGITSSQIMMTGYPAGEAVGFLSGVDLSIRLRLIDFPVTRMDAWQPRGAAAPAADALLRISGTKWILDGTPIERGMFIRQPYSDAPSTRGRMNFPASGLRVFLARALAAHEQPMLHAVGDATIAEVLDALEATGGEKWKPLRPRIEHGDMLQAADFARAARMGVMIVQNPAHFTIRDVEASRLGPERTAHVMQVRAMLDAGVPFAIGSDGPMNPFLNIMFATMNPVNPSQALTVEQALRAYTAGSAAAEFAEKERGLLKRGMRADMALLSQDIFTVPPPELPKTTSVLTIVNGRIVHDGR